MLERVVAFGDEWMPNRIRDPEELSERIEELGELAAKAGRERPPVTVYAAPAKAEVVEAYERAGLSRYVFYVPSVPRDEVKQRLDRIAGVIEEHDRAAAG